MPDAKEQSAANSKWFAGTGRKFKNFAGKYLLSGFMAAVGSLVLFLWLAQEVFEGEKIVFDEAVRQAVHRTSAPYLTQLMVGLSFTGSGIFLAVATIVFLIIFILLKWRNAFLLLLITMLGAPILDYSLKLFFQRPRPIPFFDYPPLASYSFPSGHSLASFCFYGILAWLITNRVKNSKVKLLIWIPAAVLVLLIGISRIYLGVHFPSDVLAGFAAAFVWISTVAFVDERLQRRNTKNAETRTK